MNMPPRSGPLAPGPRAPRLLRYGWALVVTIASIGGWVVDHCQDQGPAGAVLRSLWGARHPAPMPQPPEPQTQQNGDTLTR